MNSKKKITRAAIDVFFDKGFDAASMREIAEKAGVTKPMIYYHFKNKQTLYQELLEEHLNEFCERLENILARDDQYQTIFSAVIDLYETTFSKGAKIYHIIQREISGNGRFVGLLTKKYFSRIVFQLSSLLHEGMRQGKVKPLGDSHLAGLSFSAILLFYFSQGTVIQQLSHTVSPGTFSGKAFRAHIAKLFLHQ